MVNKPARNLIHANPEFMLSDDSRDWLFNHYLIGKTVALVGNSTALIEEPDRYSFEINAHDVVIRMNRAINFIHRKPSLDRSGTYEKVGLKTDVLFAARPVESVDEFPELKTIFWTCGQKELEERWPIMKDRAICLEQTWRNAYHRTHNVYPTTGYLAFWRIVNAKFFKKLDIYGYDFFESRSVVTNENNSAKWHKPKDEEEIILDAIRLNNSKTEWEFPLPKPRIDIWPAEVYTDWETRTRPAAL